MDVAPAPASGMAPPVSQFATFAIVAAAGAGLNLLPFSLGWGLDLLFGLAVVMAATRLLDRRLLIIAGALASLPTLLLWHHPAAMVTWTAEVATVAILQRRLPPIAADALFWLVLGAPLTLASYGWMLGTGGVALPLVVVKQAVNGLLNVAIGELLYHAFYATRRRHAQELPKLSLETFVLTSFAIASILPVLAFTRLAAPEKEADVRQLATARADAALAIAAQRLSVGQHGDPVGAAPLRDFGQVYLVHPDRRIQPLTGAAVPAASMRQAMLDPKDKGFLTPTAFGTSRMTSLSASVYLKSAPAPGGHGHISVLVPVSRQIDAMRVYQLQLFGLLAIIIVAIIALTTVFAREIKVSVRRLLQTAVGMSVAREDDPSSGAEDEYFTELDELARDIARAGEVAADERERLQSAQRRLRSIARNAPVAIYAVDLDGLGGFEVVFVSGGVERLLGYTPVEITRMNGLEELYHPDDLEKVARRRRALKEGMQGSFEYRLRHRDGHFVWILDSLSVERGEHAQLEVVGLLIDVSDRKAAEAELLHADKMASLGRMAVGVAHELNQPLQIMNAAVTNIRQRIRTSQLPIETLQGKLDVVVGQIERAAAIIRQMKLYGRMPVDDIVEVDVASAVRSVIAMVTPQFEASRIELKATGLELQQSVRATSLALEQVLMNLLVNAHDAVIESRRKGASSGQVEVLCHSDGTWVTIAVQDDGGGVPDQIRDRVFEPFFTTKPPLEGTGLGLSIVFGLVSGFGGHLEVRNLAGGALFEVRLPMHPASPAVAQPDRELTSLT
ncbi:PAS domain-containing sensor histidine kinase [Novosphingobium jiangmenense]|uniref:histidine kinase n=1 Tax=Novosphingobium jiangmenense TaxID=2791981 RepID=A0ABS0HBM3_9SPHN|nr:PAS domain-containing sensor histidine kinase [Novosphingobium jiangmenense]MBF9149680.1 PAS domain-containing protein [Novosphingobium jiangmenense]